MTPFKNNSKFYGVLLLAMLLFACDSYLEMKLVRIPHYTKVYNYGKVQCLTEMPEEKKDTK